MVSSVASVSRVTNSSRRCFSQRSLRRCWAAVSGSFGLASVMSCPLFLASPGRPVEGPPELVEVVVVVAGEARDPVPQGETSTGGMDADPLPVLGGQRAQQGQHVLAAAREGREGFVRVVARILTLLGPPRRSAPDRGGDRWRGRGATAPARSRSPPGRRSSARARRG